MIFRRVKYLDKIYKELENQKLVMLLGTRQVGKTTILETIKEELKGKIYYFSFEDDFFKMEFRDKKDFINYFSLSLGVDFYSEGYFLFDEFQYVKNGEQILKSLYDDREIKIKFIITGSGLWTYGENNNGTLVGRGAEIFIYPFDFMEFLEFSGIKTGLLNIENINENTNLLIDKYYNEYLTFGGYPKVVLSKTKEDKINELEKIITRYIDRDISFLIKKEELIDFKKFFIYIQSQIGNLVKKEAIGEYLGLKVRLVEKFLFILEKTLFIYRVFPFFTDKSKELSSLPKFYFGDIGVVNFLQKSFDFRENNGQIVENFIFNELQKNKKFNSDEIKTYKKITKSEIDFIYDGFDKFIPIEVKSGLKKAIPKIFFTFEQDYNKKTTSYILTSLSYNLTLNIEEKKLYIIPNWFIGKII